MKGLRRERVELKNPQQIVGMRRSGLLLAQVHEMLRENIRVGITTRELDELAAQMIREAGSRSNFLGYMGYPATCCISVNDAVVHGIPNDYALCEGDIVSIDAGCIIDGWHSDAARTHVVGEPRNDADAELVRVTDEALWVGIAALASAQRVGDIGAAIEDFVQDQAGERLFHLEDFGGHGIGTAMHQPPDVMNYRTRSRGPKVQTGMCLAIEPMLIQGDGDYVIEDDGWTVRSTRGGRAAHCENSVAVTENGLLVLTELDGGAERLAALGVQAAPDPLQS